MNITESVTPISHNFGKVFDLDIILTDLPNLANNKDAFLFE